MKLVSLEAVSTCILINMSLWIYLFYVIRSMEIKTTNFCHLYPNMAQRNAEVLKFIWYSMYKFPIYCYVRRKLWHVQPTHHQLNCSCNTCFYNGCIYLDVQMNITHQQNFSWLQFHMMDSADSYTLSLLKYGWYHYCACIDYEGISQDSVN